MAISDKLTYLNETKNLLKTQINYGLPTEEQITSSTTFRNYVSSIFNAFLEALRTPDTLFTNLPKKSGSGANITLNDTANAPMRIELSASELTQAGTPTPSSPQDIHTISGSNTIRVEGTNLLNTLFYHTVGEEINNNGLKYTFNSDGSITIKGTATAQSSINLYNKGFSSTKIMIPLDTAEYYTLATGINVSGITMYVRAINNGTLTSKTASQYNAFNGQEGITECYIQVANGTNVSNGITLYPMFLKGNYNLTTMPTYQPYTSQEADIDLSSKNLFDSITWYGAMNNLSASIFYKAVVNGIEYIKYRSSSTLRAYQFMKGQFKENTQYTLTCKARKYDTLTGVSTGFQFTYTDGTNDKKWVSNSLDEYTLDFTSASGKTIDYITIPENYNDYVIIRDIMLNEGTTALPYEPYYNYGEYCKIGNYEDRIFKNISGDTDYSNTREEGAWYIKKNIGKYTFTGNETFTKSGYTTSLIWKMYWSTTALGIDASITSGMCEFGSYDNLGGINTISNGVIANANTGIATTCFAVLTNSQITNWDDSETDANKIILAKNMITGKSFYYPLITPTYTPITGTLANQLENVYKNMLSQAGQTNISQVNNDLSFNMSVLAIEE